MTYQAHQQMMEENEEYRLRVIDWRKKIEKILEQRNGKNPSCANGPIKIPVAIHFDSGIVPAAQESCAINVTVDQIAEMNNEIAGLDSDASLINNFLSCFGAGILGDACIEFCIGQFNHPPGYGLVDGDYAITFGQVSFTIPSGNFTPVNSDWDEYINVYVDNLPGYLGVSNGIPGNFNGDGVMVDNCVFGTGNITCPGVQFTGASGCFTTYDEGETLAHELGHYLGLFHIWGDNFNCSPPQDYVDDTPNMAANYGGYLSCTSHMSCNDLPETCGTEDMYMNFMSYAGDACMYMFTSDQSDVMNATAVAEGFTTSNAKCLPPPVADFTPDSSVSLCNTDCIDFMDQSSNNPTSWTWTFTVQSGNITIDITDSNLQNPTLCLLSGDSGVLEVTLRATNAAGNGLVTKFISVSYAADMNYYEDSDGDSYGNPSMVLSDCEMPSGYVDNNLDCDDSNSNVYPGNTESCDGIDNDCDMEIDEGCTTEDCDGNYVIVDALTQDTFRAFINLSSDIPVNSMDDILFTSALEIELNGGFEVIGGTEFEARIENCILGNVRSGENTSFNLSSQTGRQSFSAFFERQLRGGEVDYVEIWNISGKPDVVFKSYEISKAEDEAINYLDAGSNIIYLRHGASFTIKKIHLHH